MPERQQTHSLALPAPDAYPFPDLRYLLYLPDDYQAKPATPGRSPSSYMARASAATISRSSPATG